MYLCKMKNKLENIEKSIQRKNAIEQGFFDGRFSQKVVSDKKKKESKNKARKKVCLVDY